MSVAHRSPEAEAAGRIVLYGAPTCEDTAITRSRLKTLGMPFREVDIDADPAGMKRVLAAEGRRVTPTVVFDGGAGVVAEPPIERLEELLRAQGHAFRPISAHQVPHPLADRVIPMVTLESTAGDRFSLEELRGRRQSAVFFAHDGGCLACYGYAKQLARQAEAMRDADAVPLIVVPDSTDRARHWEAELPPGARILVDAGSTWSGRVQPVVGATAQQVVLVLLDRWGAPRAVSVAAEAGGLVSPTEATEWLRFVDLECPECGSDVAPSWLAASDTRGGAQVPERR